MITTQTDPVAAVFTFRIPVSWRQVRSLLRHRSALIVLHLTAERNPGRTHLRAKGWVGDEPADVEVRELGPDETLLPSNGTEPDSAANQY